MELVDLVVRIAQIATPVIFGVGIPFVMKVNSRLAVIETKLENFANQSVEINKLSERVHALELKLAKEGR